MPKRLLLVPGILSLMFFLVGFMWNHTEAINQTEIDAQLINPKATALLQKSLNYLNSFDAFSLHAQNNLEDIDENGRRVDYELSTSLVVKRPDKLMVERHGNESNQYFYYNGKTLTQYTPSAQVYAQVEAPATIEEMLHFARDTYGIGAPIADLMYSNSYELLMDEVNYAEVLGTEMIGDVVCQHLLFSRPGVDFQIWISDSDKPLPYKYIVTDTTTPELLSYTSYFSNWNASPKITKDLFTFDKQATSKKIEFLRVSANDKINQ